MSEVKTTDSSRDDEFVLDYEEVDIKTIRNYEEAKVIPTVTHKEMESFKEGLDNDKLNKLNQEKLGSIALTVESEEFVTPDDIGKRKLTQSLTNQPEHDGVSIKGKSLYINKRVKTEKAALMKLGEKTGIGPNTHIPLYNSGFWVTFAPLDDEEIINLELELINELARVGKETTTLVFSNYSVIFVSVILGHFKNKILESTLKLTEDDDIFDYIDINDINVIVTYMAKSMYPNGFQAVIPCSNNAVVSGGVPKCSYKTSMKIDLSELIWVDMDKLSVNHKAQMAKKTPNSVTTDEATIYRDTLPTSGEVTKTFKNGDSSIEIILGPVNISRYLEHGTDFINELKDSAVELVKVNSKLDNLDKAERLLLKAIYLNVYNHYVRGVPIDDAVISSPEGVRNALSNLTTNVDMAKEIMSTIKTYIDDSLISVVGVPNYKCKNCKEDMTNKEIVPLAVLEYFFILLHSRYEKIAARL